MASRSFSAPRVAICMGTYEPDPTLLQRQVDSIRNQTYKRFICVISDDASSQDALDWLRAARANDERFHISRNKLRLGFYRNFERALSLVPPDAEYVAFSDQDDVWHPDKLETLLRALQERGVMLAYSDMNIVTTDGTVLAPSYWTDRRNNYTELGSLILINTVTGAASLFKRELLDLALPFPRVPGVAYHDHWIACLALALDEIAFIERPLHDYVQHGANIVGRHEPLPGEFKGGLVNALTRFVRNPPKRIRNTVDHARRYYVDEVAPREQFARTLEQRLAGRMTPEKARIVRRVGRLSSSPSALLWLLARSARDVRGESETLGIENQLIKGILWHHVQRAKIALRRPG
jgi:glycosyltransferase involved in cell wall biosynthesis